jgi:hypothetical protein
MRFLYEYLLNVSEFFLVIFYFSGTFLFQLVKDLEWLLKNHWFALKSWGYCGKLHKLIVFEKKSLISEKNTSLYDWLKL